MPVTGRTSKIHEAAIQHLIAESDVPDDVISLGQGVPFFGPPKAAMDAAADILRYPKGFRYTDDSGLPSLRAAVAKKLRHENDVKADPEKNIIATGGANQGFVNAILSVTNPGDEVILMKPHYFNYVMAIRMAGCRPVLIETADDYLPSPDEIFSKVTSDTRAVVTISPNNPTGAVYPPSLLREINERCMEMDIYHISDETYENFLYDSVHVSPASFDDSMTHTISLFSFSKSYGMPGYRIGYMAVPSDIQTEVLKIQDTVAICPPAPAQAAAEAALEVGPGYTRSFLSNLSDIRELFFEGIVNMKKATLTRTKGAFYFMVDLKTDGSTWDIAKRLIEDYGVITIPGEAFGTSGKLRISYGNLEKNEAEEGISRFQKGISNLI